MNKSTKGALAASAAGALLLGGAGTLAFWTSNQPVSGTDVTTGHLKLATPSCGSGWVLDGGAVFTTQRLVPGDTLTKVCTFALDASGSHLTADFDVTAPNMTGDAALLDELQVSAAYEVNDAPVTPPNVAVEDGDVIKATITVTWPEGVEDNGSNVAPAGLSASLDTITITATQSHL